MTGAARWLGYEHSIPGGYRSEFCVKFHDHQWISCVIPRQAEMLKGGLAPFTTEVIDDVLGVVEVAAHGDGGIELSDSASAVHQFSQAFKPPLEASKS
ncbi:MAG TPA: hypothetical protein VK988_02640 [Acidimicrobiales bacterium]|nr:hypothetical protein [Acidimicrobiales bacterium]